jgi:hypothetical protein
MKPKKWLWFVIVTALFFSAACATFDPGQTTLQEWRRSHLPTSLG